MIQTGLVIAVVTFLTIDIYCRSGLIEGTDDFATARTAGFTVLVFTSSFTCFSARSDTASEFTHMFVNPWLWGAATLSALLQVAVVNLALRAAAAEPRVERVVAYDVLTNLFDVNLRQTNKLLRALLKILLRLRAARIVNWMIARVARESPVVQWGIQQGMHVTGTSSAFEFLQSTKQFQTADVSASIRQDGLLLAGSEDHYVPIEQWHDQIRMLKNARSITARLFTRSESAQNHCQVGNYGLVWRTIINWLDEMQSRKGALVVL